MKHLDLFSGIGGFALATEMVWDDVEHVFCDNEPFSQAILKKHWPYAQIHGDIRQFTADTVGCGHVHGKSEEQSADTGEQTLGKSATGCGRFDVDILTGGFPCQPFSQAGRRRGTADDRHLWPEMLRVIREFHPRWVIGENVGGFVTWNDGMVLEQVHTDLEGEGYEVQAFIIPAVSVNAPHRRDRVWIVAHRTSRRERRGLRKGSGGGQPETKIGNGNSDAQNTIGERGRGRMEGGGQVLEREIPEIEDARSSWSQNWLEVATRLCSVDDGLRYDVVRPDGGRDAEIRPRPKGWRNAALKGAGNAIVPQVAARIMLALKENDAV